LTSLAEASTVVLSSRLWSRLAERKFVINEILKPFEQENNCKVIFNIIKDEQQLLEQIKAEVETDHVTTDVVVAYCSAMQEWVDAGYILDLTEYVNSWGDRTFPKGLANMTIFDGKQYFLPVGADVYLLIANRKALKYLSEGVEVQNISWEQLVDWSLAIAEGEGEGKFAVTGVPMKMLIYQYGGVILSYGGGFPTINSPGALQAWELLVRMKDAYTPNIMTYENVIVPMKDEDAWLTVAHCARVGDIYTSNSSQFVVAPAPKGPVGTGSVAGTSGFAIVEGAPNHSLALKLIEYMTRPDIQLKIAKGTGGFIPPVNEAVELLDDRPENEIIQKALYVMDRGVLAFIPSSFGSAWNSVKLIYERAFKKLVLEDGAVDKTWLDNAQEEIDTLEVEGLLLKPTSTKRK
jgi:multiple sugar transport system substrate-binding protein